MRGTVFSEGSPPGVALADLPDPAPGPGEVVVAVRATALNHADLLQARGKYPPPAGESAVPGLECAGLVAELGPDGGAWRVGDRVMALLAGGGHATRVVVPAGQLMPLPPPLSFEQGASLPEACLTAWTNLVVEAGLQAGETVLVTGASGGMGTMVVQIAHQLGARVLAGGRTRERLVPLCDLGAAAPVVLDDDLRDTLQRLTGGRGVDVVIDLVGGPWVPALVASLALWGRLVLVGSLAGGRLELQASDLMRRQARVIGSLLRPRTRAQKALLVRDFATFGLPRLADGRLRPVVDRVLPFARVAEAYAALAAGGAAGKIVLRVE